MLSRSGIKKRSPTLEQLGYTASELCRHIERQFMRGMSWDNSKEWDIDHIIPASSATSESDVVRLNQLSNLRPMWRRDNRIKFNKVQTLL
jgi:hypothetical protein